MAVGDTTGTVEVGQWSTLPNGVEVLLHPTKHVRRFRITIRQKPKEKRVRHRKHHGRFLTQGPESG